MAVAGFDGVRCEGGSVAEGLTALHALGPVGRTVAGRCGGGDGILRRGKTQYIIISMPYMVIKLLRNRSNLNKIRVHFDHLEFDANFVKIGPARESRLLAAPAIVVPATTRPSRRGRPG